MASIDWTTCPSGTSSLVDIGTHSLHLTIHGPSRASASDPIAVIVAGTTGTASQYPALVRALSPTIRTVLYDRSGMGLSQASPNKPTIQAITTELHSLLKATALPPPYILLGHSWGCMLSTYFISTLPSPTTSISGLILLDGGSPTISQPSDFSTDPGTPWAHPELWKVISPNDMWAAQAALAGNELTSDEMSAMAQQYATPEYQAQSQLEFAGLFGSYAPFLEAKVLSHSPPLLSGVPICLVHAYTDEAFQTTFDWGIAAGRGTEDERAMIKEKFATWEERCLANQKQLLKLTEEENRKLIMCKEHTPHNVMMFDTASIMDGMRWVLEKERR